MLVRFIVCVFVFFPLSLLLLAHVCDAREICDDGGEKPAPEVNGDAPLLGGKLPPQRTTVEGLGWRSGVREKAGEEVLVLLEVLVLFRWEGDGVANHQSDERLADVLTPTHIGQRAELFV